MSVTKATADSYIVQKDGEYARFFVDHGVGQSGNQWACLAIMSSYGNYGYFWSHMGMSYHEFLAKIDFGYAMSKLTGGNYMEFDIDETIKRLRKETLEDRRIGGIDKKEARNIYSTLEILENERPRTTGEFYQITSDNDVYFDDEVTSEKPNASSVGFWKTLWSEFATYLKALKAEEDKANG